MSIVHLLAVDADRLRAVGGASGEKLGCCRRLLNLKNRKPAPIIRIIRSATPTPTAMAVPLSRCDVGSAPKLPAGANGAAWSMPLHDPSEHIRLPTQSLLVEQALLDAVGVMDVSKMLVLAVAVDVAVEVAIDVALDVALEVAREVACGVGVAVSTARENARRELVDIIIKERMKGTSVREHCLQLC